MRLSMLTVLAFGFLMVGAYSPGGEPVPPGRVAILDFVAPVAAGWLGPAVAESLQVKLTACRGVTLLERHKLRLLQPAEATPSHLGAEFVVTGSIQLSGPVSDTQSQVRLTVRLIAADTAKVHGEAVSVVSGPMGKLFDLETALAGHVVTALGGRGTVPQLAYRDGRSLDAVQAFGTGLVALRGAVGGQEEARLKEAIALFRLAQPANGGFFFARAHHYEALARERWAACQGDVAAARTVRQATVKQFEADAHEAAPAFFNLGRALEANGNLDRSIEAYTSFIDWMAESQKIVFWKRKISFHQFWGPEDVAAWPGNPVEVRAMRQGNRLFMLERNDKEIAAILCLDWLTGETLWENRTLPATLATTLVESWRHDSNKDYSHRYGKSVAMAVAGKRLYYLADRDLAILDATTGTLQKTIPVPLIRQSDFEGTSTSAETGIYPHPTNPDWVLLTRAFLMYKQVGTHSPAQTMLVDTAQSTVRWKHNEPLYTVMGDSVLLAQAGSPGGGRVCDLASGQIRKEGFWVDHLQKRYRWRFMVRSSRKSPARVYVWHQHYSKAGESEERLDVVDVSRSPRIVETVVLDRQSMTVGGTVKKRLKTPVPFFCWDSRKQEVIRLSCSPAKARALAPLLHRSGNDPSSMVLWGDLLWQLTAWNSGAQEVRTLKGDLIHANRFGAGHAHFLVGPESRITTVLKGDQVVNARLVPPPRGTFSEVEARLRRGQCYLRLGKDAAALADANCIRSATGNNAAAEMLAGRALARLGQRREALNAFYACLHLSRPEDPMGREARKRFEAILPVVLWGTDAGRLIPAGWRKTHKVHDANFLKDIGVLELRLYPWAWLFVDLETMQVRVRSDRVKAEKGQYLPTVFEDASGRRIPMYHYPTGGTYMGKGLFYYRGFDATKNRTRIYDLLSHTVVKDVTHQVPDGFEFVSPTDRYTPECVRVGIELWERGQKGTGWCATSMEDGRLLWKARWERHCYEEVAFFLGSTLMTYGGDGKGQRLVAREPLSGKVLFKREFSLSPKDPEEPVAPLNVLVDDTMRPRLWNGLYVFEDYKERPYWMDPDTGTIGPMPKDLYFYRDMDNGLRGEERKKALADPKAYLTRHPRPESRLYLGRKEASPYLNGDHLFRQDGKKMGKAIPLCDWSWWPEVSKGMLLIHDKTDRWLIVKAEDYAKALAVE